MAQASSPRLNILDRACRKAAPVVRRHFGDIERQQVKATGHEAAAKKAYDDITRQFEKHLGEAYPDDVFFYRGDTDVVKPSPLPVTWLMDTLPATENFSRGLGDPHITATLIKGGQVVEAAAYFPLTDGLHVAQKGSGSYSATARNRVSSKSGLTGAIIGVHPVVAKTGQAGKTVAAFVAGLLSDGLSFRVSGALIKDVLSVAAGQLDGVVATGLSPYSALLAHVFIYEAGGVATDFDGKPLTLDSTTLVAGNEKTHAQLLKRLGGIKG